MPNIDKYGIDHGDRRYRKVEFLVETGLPEQALKNVLVSRMGLIFHEADSVKIIELPEEEQIRLRDKI